MRLLETRYLDGDKSQNGVKSRLCCDVIDEIVTNAFDLSGSLRQPNWVGRGDDRSLQVFLTLTNLRGVPFSFQLFGPNDPRRYGMLNHGDYLDFTVGVGPKDVPGAYALDIRTTGDEAWDLYCSGAKAIGAFPISLPPRYIKRKSTNYWHSLRGGVENNSAFTPLFPDDWMKTVDPYPFISADGGAIDNEPLELERRYLASASGSNERSGENAIRCVMTISPFLNLQKTTYESRGERVIDVVPRL